MWAGRQRVPPITGRAAGPRQSAPRLAGWAQAAPRPRHPRAKHPPQPRTPAPAPRARAPRAVRLEAELAERRQQLDQERAVNVAALLHIDLLNALSCVSRDLNDLLGFPGDPRPGAEAAVEVDAAAAALARAIHAESTPATTHSGGGG